MISEKGIPTLGLPNLEQRVKALGDKDYRLTFYERIDYLLQSEQQFQHLCYPLRYAATLRYTLDRMTLVINPDEIIVGSVKEVIPTDEQVQTVQDLTKTWWDVPDKEIQEKVLWFYSHNWLRRRPPWFYSFGHLGFNWEKILTCGLGGLNARARARLSDEDVSADPTKLDFIKGCIASYDALSAFIRRYAGATAKMAENSTSDVDYRHWHELESSFLHLSEHPARTFHEALQLIWFIVFPLMKVCGCGVLDLGRMDQYLLPFYRGDVENGVLTREGAVDLIADFYLKNNEIMSPVDHMSIEDEKVDFTLEMTFDDPNYIILGGLLPGGKPGANELTTLFVEAQHALRLRNPFIVFRYFSDIDEKLWEDTCAAIRDNATIVLYNDNTMIPALTRYGIREEDAYNYGFYGCNDPNITGKQGGLRQFWFNLVKPLEIVLDPNKQCTDFVHDSLPEQTQFPLRDRMIGLMTADYQGPKTAPLNSIESIEELLDEYRKQVRFLLADYRRAIDADIQLEKEINRGRIRIEDCFLDGPVDRALTWNDGGSIYNAITVQGSGLGSVTDSLAATSELVFQDGEMSLSSLAAVLINNFVGYEDVLTLAKHKLSKFGNDIGWVDDLARKIVEIFTDEVARQNSKEHLYFFLPTLSSDRDFTGMGAIVHATPNGRLAGDPISENQSPSVGADKHGLTAMLNSVSRIPFDRVTGGPLNIRIHPSAVQGQNGLKTFAALLKTYMESGGMQAQVNAVSREQLLEAQENPEKYRNLCVRVTGYSAYFVQMGKKAQDELIERTEHA